MQRHFQRKGFTLIELLVVIAIISVLIAMLVPAVQRVRASAQRTLCQNNLRQLAIALHNYHDQKKGFPASGYNVSPGQRSWIAEILPFIEQGTMGYDVTIDWNTGTNVPLAQTPLFVVLCPSMPTNGRKDGTYAACDYAVASQVNAQFYTALGITGPADKTGVLQRTKMTKMVDVLDGTSNTILLVEDAGRPESWKMGVRKALTGAGNGAWADPASDFDVHGCDPATTNTPGVMGVNCSNHNEIYGFHEGGAMSVMADASIRFLRSTLLGNILAALVTKAGEEPIPTGID